MCPLTLVLALSGLSKLILQMSVVRLTSVYNVSLSSEGAFDLKEVLINESK